MAVIFIEGWTNWTNSIGVESDKIWDKMSSKSIVIISGCTTLTNSIYYVNTSNFPIKRQFVKNSNNLFLGSAYRYSSGLLPNGILSLRNTSGTNVVGFKLSNQYFQCYTTPNLASVNTILTNIYLYANTTYYLEIGVFNNSAEFRINGLTVGTINLNLISPTNLSEVCLIFDAFVGSGAAHGYFSDIYLCDDTENCEMNKFQGPILVRSLDIDSRPEQVNFINDLNTITNLSSDPLYKYVEVLLPMKYENSNDKFIKNSAMTFFKYIFSLNNYTKIEKSENNSKYYGSSCYFYNIDSGIYITPGLIEFGINSFCVESWIKLINLTTENSTFFHYSRVSYSYYYFTIFFNSTSIIIYFNQSLYVTINYVLPLNTWFHFAIVRNLDNIKIFINGIQIFSSNYSSIISGSSNNYYSIGSIRGLSNFLNGYMNDFRFTFGHHRYSDNFTPPGQLYDYSPNRNLEPMIYSSKVNAKYGVSYTVPEITEDKILALKFKTNYFAYNNTYLGTRNYIKLGEYTKEYTPVHVLANTSNYVWNESHLDTVPGNTFLTKSDVESMIFGVKILNMQNIV